MFALWIVYIINKYFQPPNKTNLNSKFINVKELNLCWVYAQVDVYFKLIFMVTGVLHSVSYLKEIQSIGKKVII